MDTTVAAEVKEDFQQLAMKLEMLSFNQMMYETRKSAILRNLNRLAELRVQKDSFKAQFQAINANQKAKQQQQQVVQNRNTNINNEIARLQAEL